MPTAGEQTFKHCLASDDRIEMKWLRIEFARERNDLFFVDLIRAGFEPVAFFQAFKKTFSHGYAKRMFFEFVLKQCEIRFS